MEIILDFWYLLPIATCIATIAMASGVGGAIFFSPLFILVLGLDAQVAIGTALLTELFGFSSGLLAYMRSKLIDFKIGWDILKYSIPAAIVGSLGSSHLPPDYLKALFGIGILYIGFQMYKTYLQERKHSLLYRLIKVENHSSLLIDSKNREYRYTYCNKPNARFFGFIGGAFVGLISVGLGELMDYHLVSKCKVPTPVAVATAVFCVVVTVLIASSGHFYEFFFHSEDRVVFQVVNVVIFTIPGVLIGGQLGPRLQRVLPEVYLKIGLSTLFLFIGFLMLSIVVFS